MNPTGQSRPWPVTRANPRPELYDTEALGRARAAADGMIDESVARLIAAATEQVRQDLIEAEAEHTAAMLRYADYHQTLMKRQRIKALVLDALTFVAGGAIGYALSKVWE